MRSPFVFITLVGATLLFRWFDDLKLRLTLFIELVDRSGWTVFFAGLLLAACATWFQFRSASLFIWHCFIAPLGDTKDQKSRLDKFYEGQAKAYDETRAGLLKGRKTMLAMSAEHLRVIREKSPEKRLVWVDIGGGTGWNIEKMNTFFPITSFDAIYLVDLCRPLLDLAQKRFRERGWKNVICICQDASTFVLPEWYDGVHPRGSVSFITLSYSLSMVNIHYRAPFNCFFKYVNMLRSHHTTRFSIG